jgi:hypothetical protein
MPGKLRNQVYICNLGYEPGMPMAARPGTTPGCEPHTPWPPGYIAGSDYADLMMQTHDQRQCRGCGLWAIWEPKPGVPAPTRAGD